MRGLANRIATLELKGSGLSHLSDAELGAAYEQVIGALSRHVTPPCGWDAPLSRIIGWLEREE